MSIIKKIKQFQKTEELGVIDLFSGCGGMSLGFQKAGCGVIAGIEIDELAATTHERNFSYTSQETEKNLNKDITTLSPKDFADELNKKFGKKQSVDVIIGGPPCQAFARIGRAKLREITKHPEGFLQDDRANLYLHFLEYVDFFSPLVVVMENVIDIMNYGGKNVAEEIAVSLDELGYETRYSILNSAHYGVPQMRQRFFLIGFHKELDLIPEFPQPTHFIKLPQGYASSMQVALGGLNQTLFNYGVIISVL